MNRAAHHLTIVTALAIAFGPSAGPGWAKPDPNSPPVTKARPVIEIGKFKGEGWDANPEVLSMANQCIGKQTITWTLDAAKFPTFSFSAKGFFGSPGAPFSNPRVTENGYELEVDYVNKPLGEVDYALYLTDSAHPDTIIWVDPKIKNGSGAHLCVSHHPRRKHPHR